MVELFEELACCLNWPPAFPHMHQELGYVAVLIWIHAGDISKANPIINFQPRDSGLLHEIEHIASAKPREHVVAPKQWGREAQLGHCMLGSMHLGTPL